MNGLAVELIFMRHSFILSDFVPNICKIQLYTLNPYTAELIVVCLNCRLLHFKFLPNLEDILTEWQTAWILTRCLVWFQAVCKDLIIMISRLKVKAKLHLVHWYDYTCISIIKMMKTKYEKYI